MLQHSSGAELSRLNCASAAHFGSVDLPKTQAGSELASENTSDGIARMRVAAQGRATI